MCANLERIILLTGFFVITVLVRFAFAGIALLVADFLQAIFQDAVVLMLRVRPNAVIKRVQLYI
jgi:hypothetical protein